MANEIGSTLVNSLTNSTFDIGNMAKVLAEAEVASPRAILERKTESVNTELSALRYLETNLNAFQTYVTDLSSPDLFRELSVSSSNDSIVSATAQNGAATGSYQIESKQLAQTNSLIFSQTYASSQTLISDTGSFEFTVNGQTTTIALDANTGTLEGLENYINSGNYGVSAAVVNDGTGYRFMMTSKTSGAAGEITFGVNQAGFPSGSDPLSYEVTSAAQDALMEINGLPVYSNNNTFNNVIEGVSFQLNSASPGVISTLDVNRSTDKVEETIRSFVDVYNQLDTIIDELGSYDSSTLTEEELASPEYAFYGDLAGNSVLRTVKEQIRSAMSGSIDALDAGFNALAFAGVNFDREGVLNIDETTFSTALNNNLDQVSALFSKGGSSDSAVVNFLNGSDRTETGNYQIDITQEATRAQWTFAAQAGGVFDITLDGNSTVTLNAPTDTSDLQAYSVALVNTINSSAEISGAGASVSAYVNAANEIVLQSDRYGQASSISLSIANTGDPALEIGKNVDGTITTESGGTVSLAVYADNDDGRKVSISNFAVASDGDTSMRGLEFEVLANPGTTVNFNFAQGFASRLEETINSFFESDIGLISQRFDSLNQKNDDYEEKAKKIDARYEALEMKYRLQFSMLQSIMSSAEATRNQLSAQFSNNDS